MSTLRAIIVLTPCNVSSSSVNSNMFPNAWSNLLTIYRCMPFWLELHVVSYVLNIISEVRAHARWKDFGLLQYMVVPFLIFC